MNKILYLHIYYERNKYICKTMYFKNSLKTTFLYMQGSRDILCCAHVFVPGVESQLKKHILQIYIQQVHQSTCGVWSGMKIDIKALNTLCSKMTMSECLPRHVSPQVGFFHVNLQDVFKWWFVQSILWLSSAPSSAVSRHRFSASGVQWSTRVRTDRTSPWHWFSCYAHQCIFRSSLSINLTC